MAEKKCVLAVVIVALMPANAPETVRGPAVGTASWTLSGRVYEGERGVEPPGSTPLAGVTVELHGSNDPGGTRQFLTSTATDASGRYGLPVLGGWEFYFIIQVDPPGYYSVGATSVGGTVCGLNRIRHTLDVPHLLSSHPRPHRPARPHALPKRWRIWESTRRWWCHRRGRFRQAR